MKKLAFIALAGALVLAPVLASASNDTTPKSIPPGGGAPLQTQYLNTQTTINFTVTPACTSLTTPDNINFSAQPTTNVPTAQSDFLVLWSCGAGIAPSVTFLSTTNQCKLVNGPNGIPYSIFAGNATSGTNLCNSTDGGFAGNSIYNATATDTSNGGKHFNIVTGPLVNGGGQSIYPAQTYSDTVQVYLDF